MQGGAKVKRPRKKVRPAYCVSCAVKLPLMRDILNHVSHTVIAWKRAMGALPKNGPELASTRAMATNKTLKGILNG